MRIYTGLIDRWANESSVHFPLFRCWKEKKYVIVAIKYQFMNKHLKKRAFIGFSCNDLMSLPTEMIMVNTMCVRLKALKKKLK